VGGYIVAYGVLVCYAFVDFVFRSIPIPVSLLGILGILVGFALLLFPEALWASDIADRFLWSVKHILAFLILLAVAVYKLVS
jgi:xanthosine utilization system XapX-like protein